MADTKAKLGQPKSGLLLDIRNLRIEATVFPPGEPPKTAAEKPRMAPSENDRAVASTAMNRVMRAP